MGGASNKMRRSASRVAPYARPDVVAFALLAFLAPWLSIFSSRVLGGVLPVSALIAIVGVRWARGRFPKMAWGPWCFAALVALLCGVSSFWTADPVQSFDSAARIAGALIAGLLLYYAAGEIDDEARVRLRGLFLWSFIFGLLLMLMNSLTSAGVYSAVKGASSIADPETEANRPMVILILFVWPAVLAAMQLGRARLAIALPVLTILVSLLTESQTAPVAGAVALAVYWWTRISPPRGRALVLWGGILVLAAMPWAVLLLQAFDPQIRFDWHEASSGARLEIWYAVADQVRHAVLLGHGVEAARFVQDWHMSHIYFPAGKGIQHPHNGPLQIWYEFGALGAAIAIWIWAKLTQRLGAMDVTGQMAALACLMAILTVSSISHGLWQSWWLGAIAICPTLFRIIDCPQADVELRA